MGFVKELDTKTFINQDLETLDKEIVCIFLDCFEQLPTAELSEDTVILTSDLDSLIIDFEEQTILDVISNIGDITLLLVTFEELPDKGALYFDGDLVEQSFVFNFSDIDKLQYQSSGYGLNYSSIKLRLKPVPDPVSEWSQLLTVIFNIPKTNPYQC